MNKMAGRVLTVLVSIQMVLALFLVGVANFADGGTWWERGFLSVLHPLAVALLLAVLLVGHRGSSRLSRTAIGVLGVYVVGAVGISVAILTGLSKGDWFLSLVLAIVPVAGLAYLLTARTPEAVVSG
ncbi:MAG: hypothetical protein F4Y08_08905 [Caldilineaceae bacterium SB0662_bin_9]|uniref:Uncharacterized protein n=1 Tax=Caldilineaceae bacterium SB0662_bin_9 TaxID=2605258 RepID=A0A6B1DUF2_9CHLR|nr:hypothetical protein [Caldilineaceae bacterium SB0664_bin_22]MYD90435.1 hypothetical protein [Caldilineaceae bacterium SB0662_bin_9]